MILKKVKVVCFDRLLKVYDSRGLTSTTSLGATPLWNEFSKLEKARESEGLRRVTQMELYHNAIKDQGKNEWCVRFGKRALS